MKRLLLLLALFTLLPALTHAQGIISGNRTTITQGGNDAEVLAAAPGSDTGQKAVAVRIISSLAAGSGGTSSNFGSAFPAAGTAAGFSDGTNMRPGLAADLDTGAGTQYGQLINLVKRASGGAVEAGTSTDPLRIDPTGTTTQPVSISAGNFPDNEPFNVAQINGVAPLMGNGLTGTGSQRVTIASDNTAFSVNATLQTGTNLIGKVVPSNTCGTTAFDSGLTENIATGAGTDLTATATCVAALFVTNKTTSAVNVTIKDKSGTPKTYMDTFSLPANSNITLPLWFQKFTGGITVIAGTASALNAAVVGFQ